MEASDSDSEIKTGIIEKDAWSMTVPKFLPEHNKHGMIEESKFAFLYPAYREKYLREVWPMVQKKLSEEHHLKAELDVIESTMTVKTTRKAFDTMLCSGSRKHGICTRTISRIETSSKDCY